MSESLLRRVKKAEELAGLKSRERRLVVAGPHETVKEALARMGLDGEDEENLLIVKLESQGHGAYKEEKPDTQTL